MTEKIWISDLQNLEKILGFILECPRCRSWDLSYQDCPQEIRIKCQRCEIKLLVFKESLINRKELILPSII